MTQWYIQHDTVTLRTDPATGEEVRPDFQCYGPFASAADATRAAAALLPGRTVAIRAGEVLPGMVPCAQCGLGLWPEEQTHEGCTTPLSAQERP